MGAVGEILVDLAPVVSPVEQHVTAVPLVHQRACLFQRLFGVDDERQPLVSDLHLLGGVLGQGAGIGDDRRDPFAGVTRDFDRRAAAAGRAAYRARSSAAGWPRRVRRRRSHNARRALPALRFVDADDARGGVGAGDQRHVLGAGQVDVGDKLALADDEAAVLAHAAVGGDEAEALARSFGSSPPDGWRRACARRRARSLRRSARSRCSGRCCRRWPRRSPRASARDCRRAERAAARIIAGVQ